MTEFAISRLRSVDAEILSATEEPHRSGIVTFRFPNESPQHLRQVCLDAGIVLSCRGGGLRISPHAYNDESEIERLVEVLREARS